MTMKTKRGLAIGGGTALCAALAVLITMRFAPDNKPTADSTSTSSSTSQISAEVTASKHEETKPAEQDNSSALSESEIPDDNAGESSVTEVVQNFPEPEKESVPPAPPKIEDEETLTNPDKEPAYEPEQTEVKPQETPSDTPKHGDKKDGKIYINGFGWIDDEGGGGEGEYLDGMYENGNKIGYFG